MPNGVIVKNRRPDVNPNRGQSMLKLSDSIDWSRRRYMFSLERRMETLRAYVGHRYSDEGAEFENPLPMLNVMVDTFYRDLVSDNPKVDVSTEQFDDEAIVTADDIRLGINYALDKSGASEVYARGSVDAIFGLSMFKVGLDPTHFTRPGRHSSLPYVSNVFPEDVILDMTARIDEEIWYIGNEYRVPLEWAKENLNYVKPHREDLTEDDGSEHWNEDEARPEVFSRGRARSEGFIPTVTLVDIYLPLKRLIVTAAKDRIDKPLSVREWEGPDNHPLGMYHVMRFGNVPGNILPLAPATVLLDLHELMNRLFNKAASDMLNAKTVLGVDMGSLSDGETVRDACHGQVVPLINPNGVKEYKFNGPDAAMNGMVIYLRDIFSYMAGNLDLVGGLAAGSPTATQDKLLSTASNKKLEFMQKQAAKLQRMVAQDIGWYLWNDPTLQIPLKKEVAGIEIPFTLTPSRLKGDYYSLNFRVDPYTLPTKSPEQKLATIMAIMGQAMPFVEAGQAEIDVEYFVSLAAKLTNTPEIKGLLKPASVTREQTPAKVAPSRRSETHNFRHNVPQSTREGNDRTMMATMLGSNKQPKEKAAATRPAS